jgi:hypothetical protein
MQLFRKITRLRCLPFLLLTLGLALSAGAQTTPEALVAGTTGRINAIFQADSGKAFVPAKVLASLGSGRPYYSRAYSWSVAGFAARCFYLGEMLPQANAALIQNGKYYLRQLTPQEEASILDANAGVEQNTGQYARITNRDSVHWHADIILRLIDMYGTNGSVAAGRMSPDAEAKSLEYIWQYVRLIGKLSKAEYLISKTWDSYESENHHAMDFRTHWHFSKIAKDHVAYMNLTTASGATAAQLYEAYNNYFIEYARERFRKGLFAEMMNRGYNSATYTGFYNFYDFGNPEVREHARMLLDLFWAYYAQEQFNDVVGGGAARIDFSAGFTAGHAGTTGALAWSYFGKVSKPSSVDGRTINPYFSSYRPPAVIADIATDIAGRGTYEIRQTAQGLGVTGSTNPDVSQANTPHRLRTDGGGIVRYSYCNPAFIMGLPMLDARPGNDWVAYCSQSRWQGVVFSATTANEMARIVPCVLPTSGEDTFNPHWGVQSKGSMITQMLNTHSGGKEMWVFISKQGLNANPFIEDNIVFVDIAGAYAAIRVVGTTYTLHEDYDPDYRPHFLVRLTDKFKPVILEVKAKTQVADFAIFKQMVKANTPTFANNLVTYTTIYGDTLTFDASYTNPPTINTVPVDYSPTKSFDSPFLHGDYNGNTFVIEKGSRQQVYSFSMPPLVTGFSPADNSGDVAINANLTVTFNESISAGSGLITIKNLTNSTQTTISITDATQVSISGATLTINPTNNLLNSNVYAIQIAAGAVANTAGAAFAGIANDTMWNFTTAAPPQTGITVVQSGSHIDGIIDATAGGKTITINAGAADFLIVGTSTEFGSGNSFTANFAGNPMTLATGNGSQSNLFYLDLTQTTYSGGNANLTFTWNYTTGGDLAVGWVSVDGNLQAGESIVLHKTAFAPSSTNTVSLVTTGDDTFNFVNFNGNRGNDASAPQAPLTEIYSDGDFGSNAGAAGYERAVGSGTHNYAWNHDALRRIDAAAFAVVGDFSVWIADYPGVGTQTGLGDDPDGDGLPNGLEAWFGTRPDQSSGWLTSLNAVGNATTFTHPRNANPPPDLSIFYEWSSNLVDWYACDGVDGPISGQTVSVSTNTTTTVTATSSGPMPRLFLRARVTHP